MKNAAPISSFEEPCMISHALYDVGGEYRRNM